MTTSPPSAGLHFEVLDFSVAPRQIFNLSVGSVVYAGGTLAWDQILSSERRWLFEQLDALIKAWFPLGEGICAGQWHLEGRLLPDDSPTYTISHRADESAPWTPAGSWEQLSHTQRMMIAASLQEMLDHIQGLLTIY